MGRDRSAEPLVWRRWDHRIDETLARGANQKRQAERFQAVEPGYCGHALLGGLAEADAGVEDDEFAMNTGVRGDGERAVEERRDIGHDVDARIRGVAVVHDDDRYSIACDHRRHLGVTLQ